MDRSTVAAQLNQFRCHLSGGITPPIHTLVTYERPPDADWDGPIYARDDNPTFIPPESALAVLEEGAAALLFASGMAAATAIAAAFGNAGTIIFPDDFYAGMYEWTASVLKPHGYKCEHVDLTDLSVAQGAIESADGPVLVWLETPSTPTLALHDIRAISEISHRAGATVVVDSTSSSPFVQQPLALGADLVLHSGTKWINGHDDLVAGAVVTAQEDALWERILKMRTKMGAVIGGFEAWLLGRGMRTMEVRVRRSSENALAIATQLESLHHPAVARTIYPGLRSHPQHSLAAEQMPLLSGGIFSFECKSEMLAKETMKAVKLWRPATSLGGVQSMLEQRKSVEPEYGVTPPGLVRCSVGLESVADLNEDLIEALDLALRVAT